MKKSSCLLAVVALLVVACKEKELQIPDLNSGNHKVLVEELTGVRCAECPDGAADLQAFAQAYGKENLIIVSIHAAVGFSAPYTNESLYDFQFPGGYNLASYIGSPIGYPAASIDRVFLNNTTFHLIGQWPSLIASEFGKDHHVGLFLQKEYDPANRQLNLQINVAPEQTLDEHHRLSVFITQDSIVDVQKVGPVKVPNYLHRHVLRQIITQVDGNPLGTIAGGEFGTYEFEFKLSPEWVAEHCSVVAFVHRDGTPDKAVLQALEEHITD